MPRADHPLFRAHPLAGAVQLSTGAAPVPYHVYDGYGLFVGGMADLGAVQQLLAPEQVRAVRTACGRALMGVWVFDFSDASLGAHHELQFSIFVSRGDAPAVPSHPLALIEAMLERPDMKMLCHGLWNSTPAAVAYNRERLGLDARVSTSRIEREAGTLDFRVHDAAGGAPVLLGRVHGVQRPSLRANFALVARLGPRRIAALARRPWIGMQVLNRVAPGRERNAAADSFTRADRSVLRHFDPARDRLTFGDARYGRLGFEPQFFQFMEGFRFVYLDPA